MIALTVRVIGRLYVLLVWVFFGRRSERRYDDRVEREAWEV